MVNSGPWNVPTYLAAINDNFDMTELPHNKQKASILNIGFSGVSAYTKVPDAAFKLAMFFISEPVMKVRAQDGNMIGPYRPVFESNAWLRMSGINRAAFIKSIKYSRLQPPLIREYTLIEPIWRAQMAPMWTGEVSVQSATIAIDQLVNAILQPGQK